MIVSIHIPKSAGTSFGMRLESEFGARLLKDYGDWVGLETPDAIARRAARVAAMRARREELLRDYDVIHGHFVADKYLDLFPTTALVAFFRDPYQQAVSNYHYLMRHPEIDHPGVKLFHEVRPSLLEFIAGVPASQSNYLGRATVEDFAMVGLTEQYDRGVALFEAIFSVKLPPEKERGNVNPDRQGEVYEIDPAIREAIDQHRPGDVKLYRRAVERFARLAANYNV